MKYTYDFLTDENTIEIDEKWTNLLLEFDRAEEANQKKENRKHYHLEGFKYEGKTIIDKENDIDTLFADPTREEMLHIAISKLKPKQQELINAIYFQGVSVND